MTKSSPASARTALSVARQSIPVYPSKFSPHRYAQHQLYALMALREFLKLDYRGLEQVLKEWSELREALELAEVPDHSAIQKAARRPLETGVPTPSCGGDRAALRALRLIAGQPRAALDATGYGTRHISRYFAWRSRRRRRGAWPKLTAVTETEESNLLLSAHVSRDPSQDSPGFRPKSAGRGRPRPDRHAAGGRRVRRRAQSGLGP